MPKVDRNNPKRGSASESDYSLMEFMREFPDDAACLNWLWKAKYAADGVHAHCPKCKANREFKRYEIKVRRQSWTCTTCGHHIHPTAGTIFHKSATSLHLWFYAMYLMTSTRCGISAKQLEREIGVGYKTAWRMANLIRTQLMQSDDEPPLSGRVEMDETYIGGRQHGGKRGRATLLSNKTPVVGLVERSGRVIARTAKNASSKTLLDLVKAHILPESTVFTDEWRGYDGISYMPKKGYVHRRIKHKTRVYVVGDVHTNTIEGFWSLVKNGLKGVYHSISEKHLQSYLSEYAWRYNRRSDPKSKFQSLIRLTAG